MTGIEDDKGAKLEQVMNMWRHRHEPNRLASGTGPGWVDLDRRRISS